MSEQVSVTQRRDGAVQVDAIEAELAALLAQADIQVNGSRPWDMRVNDPAVFPRIAMKRSLGLGESYMDGWWDCAALDEFFYRILRADGVGAYSQSRWMLTLQLLRSGMMNRQSLRRASEVAHKHYDLDNELFELMLDETMAYSCGYWRDATTLHEAQIAKLDLICRKMALQPGMKVLDIGCGWGSFLHYAATHYGVEIDGITVSVEQARYAEQRCAGLSARVLLKDYREIDGSYDRIVSVGMFEHVGEKNYRTFMEVVDRLLRADGLALLHTIGDNYTSHSYDPWINRYIFPNGKLPSMKQIIEAAEHLFIVEDFQNFGPDYAKTLKAWDQNFCRHWDRLKDRYDQRFYRMWRYYLNCCMGAFRARNIQLWLFVLAKPGWSDRTYTAPR
jgi:cyclopropane-fatty-acyl-phospholipid synthase